MKELTELSEQLTNELNKKEKELQEKVDCDIYLRGHLENRRNEVQAFADSIKDITKDPFLKNEVIKNYTTDADRIISEIRQIE